MATKIVTKNSSTASAVPTASDLVQGELAVNVADKRLYTEDSVGGIVELGTNPSAEIVANGGIALPDNGKATFGASDDLQIYHDGTNSHIREGGTGQLYIRAYDGINLQTTAAENYFTGAGDGAATVYYNGIPKLATTATGIDVTGTATMDGLTVDKSSQATIVATSDSTVDVRLVADTSLTEGSIRTSGTTPNLGFYVGGTKYANISDGGDISFYEDTGTTPKLFWDASAESLGIGTSSPDTQLTLYKASTNADVNYAKMRMDSWGGSTGKLKSIAWDDNGSPVAAIGAEYDGAKTNIHFHSQYNGGFKGTSDRTMSIMGNGNVGIGTSSPVSELDVAGTTPTLTIKDTQNKSWTSADTTLGELAFRTSDTSGIGAHNVAFVRAVNEVASATTPSGALSFGISASNANASEAMRIDSSGDMIMKGGRIKVRESDDGNDAVVITRDADEGYVNLYSAGSQTIEIRGNGNSYFNGGDVGIGTSSPTFTLEVNGGGAADNLKVESQSTLTNFYQTTSGGTTVFQNNNGSMAMFTGGAERMRIDSSGNLLVGTTSTLRSNKFHASSSNFVGGFNVTNGTGEAVAFFSNGTVVGTISVTGSTTTYNTSSDQRLKENIADADDAGSKIDAIQVRKYDWKADGSHQDYGMIAQELQAVAPEAVSGDADSEEMMGVDYSKLVPMLIKEIQSLRNRVAQLEE